MGEPHPEDGRRTGQGMVLDGVLRDERREPPQVQVWDNERRGGQDEDEGSPGEVGAVPTKP